MGEILGKPAAVSASLTRTVVAGAVGNVLEWYDFGLFGYFAPVIAREFLPSHDPLASLLGTFGVFATGFLMRPLGGLIFGFVGDRLGRKLALELSVVLMALATTLLGLLPTYASIGLAAPLLLTILRLFQGLSVGGEYIGSMSFLAEHAPPGRRAFFGSWSSFSVVLGSLLGSATAAVCTRLLSEPDLVRWGWRLPFLAGLLIGLLGLWLRLGVKESPCFEQIDRSGQLSANPIVDALRHDGFAIVMTLGLGALLAVGFYLPFVWLPTWLAHINQRPLPEDQALFSNCVALLALLVLTPVTAVLSDYVGRRPMYLSAALGYALLSYPLFVHMSSGTYPSALAGGLVFAVFLSLPSGCMAAAMVELFPTRTRYTGVAIGYNLAQALMGGTAPLVATALIHTSGNDIAPAWYIAASAIITGFAACFIPARHNQPL
jgi:MHS family proline/betaine transporter-like MFS transporter